MIVIDMRTCVRCGITFRPLEAGQLCCSDDCSAALQGVLSLLPAVPERRPMPPELVVTARPRPTGRRGPIFMGQRFVVFEWQLEQLARLLGPSMNDFDLHEWFFTLDAQVANSHEMIPQRDGGQWLQARTLEEAQRRGLLMASAAVAAPKQARGSICPHEPTCRSFKDCTGRIIRDGRARRGES